MHDILPATMPQKQPACVPQGTAPEPGGAWWQVSESPAIALHLASDARLWARDATSGCLLQWSVFWPVEGKPGPKPASVDVTLPDRDGKPYRVEGWAIELADTPGLEILTYDPATYDHLVILDAQKRELARVAEENEERDDVMIQSWLHSPADWDVSVTANPTDGTTVIDIDALESAHDTEVEDDGTMSGTISENFWSVQLIWDPTTRTLTRGRQLDSYEGDWEPYSSVSAYLQLAGGARLYWYWSESKHELPHRFRWLLIAGNGTETTLAEALF